MSDICEVENGKPRDISGLEAKMYGPSPTVYSCLLFLDLSAWL
jgi:hypothetical protein